MLHHNELITIEEETILNVPSSRNGMQRKFTLTNRGSKFSFGVLSSGGSIVSIKVNNGTHEVVLPTSLVSYLPVSTANNQIGPSNRRDLDSYPAYCEWTSHVLGSDTLLLTAPSSQSVIYQLTSSDEFIITGKVKNFHAIAPFYLNLNSPTADISGHFLQVRCLHPANYEVIACHPPTSGSNYNYVVSHTANSNEDVNSTTSNVSSVTSVELPLRFDLITGSFLTFNDESVDGGANEGQSNFIGAGAGGGGNGAAGGRNGDQQRGPSGHWSLIQDAVYTVVPVICSNSNESASGNVSSSNNGEASSPFDGSSETAVASSSSTSSWTCRASDSEQPLAPAVRSSSSASSSATNSLLPPPPPPPVLLLTLSYQGRSIEMSLQCNSSSSNSGQNNGTLGNNLLTSNSVHLPFVTNGSYSHASSSNSNFVPVATSGAVTSGTQYDSVKLRVRIRKDGISFMPVGMNDFKCIYKVKW